MRSFVYILTMFFFVFKTHAQEIIDSVIVVSQKIVYFDTDQYLLTPKYKDSLSSLLQTSEEYDSVKWIVKAHTDKVGSLEYNISLSEKRQNSVVRFLLQNGISEPLISSSSHGESLPTSVTNDELNRRAFVQIAIPKKYLYLKGKIVDRASRIPLRATVEVKSKEFLNEKSTDTTGEFRILAPLHENVSLTITSKGYFFESHQMSVSEKLKERSITLSLPKLEAGSKYLFRNLLFLGNRSVITPDSEWNIFHLQRFMEINDEVCIEVNGHINLPGREKVRVGSSNFELSVARAIVIKKKLIEGGIVKDRMRVKGNGNWEMKYPNAKTPEQTQQNRRVEIGVLNCETLNSESGDTLEDLERYRFHVINRKYSARLLLSDLEYLAQMEGVSITLEAEKMKSKGLDPSKYTYRELHFAHHNLAKPKE